MSHQTRLDSLMEALTNVAVGFIINFTANMLVLPWLLDVPADPGVFAIVGVIYTVISVARSYGLRRLFNGKSVWAGLKDWFRPKSDLCIYCGQPCEEAPCPVLTKFLQNEPNHCL